MDRQCPRYPDLVMSNLNLWPSFLDQLAGMIAILIAARLSLLLSWPLFLWLEKRSPAAGPVPRSNFWFNWQITLSNMILSPVFAAVVLVATLMFAQWLNLPSLKFQPALLGFGVPVLDTVLQGAVIFLVACVVGDFHYYWWHRFQHTVPWLWELHKLHHSDENLNTTTIYRSHFLEPAGQALFRGLSVALVFDTSAVEQTALYAVAAGLLPVLWDYYIHANVRVDGLYRLLPWFSNPQFHWIHHSRLPQHQDKNFSIWIPLYDKLFGTYYQPALNEYPPTGLSSGERIETLREAHLSPFVAWLSAWRQRRAAPVSKEQTP